MNQPLRSNNESFIVRRRMSELTDLYGPIWTGKKLAPPGQEQQQDPSDQQNPGNGASGLSERAQARKDKLELQDNHPPDSTNIGGTGGQVEITEQQFLSMSDDEIMALPASTRRKFDPEA